MTNFEDLVRTVVADTDPASNPYFVALRDGSFERDDFVETQIQFYYVVTFFSRPMAVVAARIPDGDARIEIVRNVWEEHGEGDPKKAHGATFREFLKRLDGIEPTELAERALWPEARLFDSALSGTATLDEHIVGVSMLGIIEHMFVDISRWIGRAVVDRGWLSEDEMIHYDLHEALDVKHSRDFFDVLAPTWESDPSSRYRIEQGLRLGATAFDTLYRGLYRSRKRRAGSVPGRGPHARS